MSFDFSKYHKGKSGKSRYLSLHFSPSEWEKIESYSKNEGIKKSQMARELMLAGFSAYEGYKQKKGK